MLNCVARKLLYRTYKNAAWDNVEMLLGPWVTQGSFNSWEYTDLIRWVLQDPLKSFYCLFTQGVYQRWKQALLSPFNLYTVSLNPLQFL